MASNPLQRKARNSFILGMLLMLIITGAIIAFLFIQLKNYQDKEAADKKLQKTIYLLNQDVKSGQIITSDMLTSKQVYSTMIPNNAIGDVDTLENYSLQDKEGNTVSSKIENGEQTLYITINGKSTQLKTEDVLGAEGQVNYYIDKRIYYKGK